MFVFGHLGIGSGLVLLAKRDLPLAGVLTGTIVPDLVDKPLFYGLVRTRVLPAAIRWWLPGTRTVGHTLVAVLVVALLATIVRPGNRAWVAALALGMLSHDLLDVVSDFAGALQAHTPFVFRASSAWRASFFPLAGTPFAANPSAGAVRHFLESLRVHLASELLGLACIVVGAVVTRTRRMPANEGAAASGRGRSDRCDT